MPQLDSRTQAHRARPHAGGHRRSWPHRILLLTTLMLSGRAMTLAFLKRVGGTEAGDPPLAWLMPLVGDAVIGVTALLVAWLIWRPRGLIGWTTVVAWNAVAIWDALSAYAIHRTVPWPSFFMIEIFGPSMFFAASALHAACLYLIFQPAIRNQFFTIATGDQT